MSRGEQMFWMMAWGSLLACGYQAFITKTIGWPSGLLIVTVCVLIGLLLWGVERLLARSRSKKLLVERDDTADE